MLITYQTQIYCLVGIYIFWFICYFYLNMNKMGLLWVFLSGEEMGNWFRHIFVNKSESPNWLHVQILSSLNMEQIIQWEISFSTIVLPKSSRYRIFRTFLMTPDVLLHGFFFFFFGVCVSLVFLLFLFHIPHLQSDQPFMSALTLGWQRN